MAKPTTAFLCTACGETFSKWMGKCSACEAWNTITEFRESRITSTNGKQSTPGRDLFREPPDIAHSSVSDHLVQRIPSGITEVDRVLGGGFFPGSFILFGGSPGIGKSTLSLQIFSQQPAAYYFSGEESRHQVGSHLRRLPNTETSGKVEACLPRVFSTNALEDICETVQRNNPKLVVIDSIQMICSSGGSIGQLSQIRENAEVLLRLAKSTHTVVVIIGHVTKEEEIAGPKILEHLVDTVLYLEGERNTDLRMLRATKNRFGSTQEIGVFTMTGNGLQELLNPSAFFLSERSEQHAGAAITVIREGNRNFLVEVQALTVRTHFGLPRRTAHGIDLAKLHLLLAVLTKFTPFKGDQMDAYLNVVSGFRVREPAADLAICAALLSSATGKNIPSDTILLGEVGLSGEIRSVAAIEPRLREAAKLGFRTAIVPRLPTSVTRPKEITLREFRTISDLARWILHDAQSPEYPR